MDQQQLFDILNRIATALERQAFALDELLQFKADELRLAAKMDGRSLYPIRRPRQYLRTQYMRSAAHDEGTNA